MSISSSALATRSGSMGRYSSSSSSSVSSPRPARSSTLPSGSRARRQSRMKSSHSPSPSIAEDHKSGNADAAEMLPPRRTTKRRTKSESAVWTLGADVPLTKTGRIKRALKGQKVHKCHCGKIYTRNEHLRRHQLSHGEPSLTCEHPGCTKGFFRNDLHCRHMKNHESPPASLPEEPELPALTPIDTSMATPRTEPYFSGLNFLADTAAMLGIPEPTADGIDMTSLYQYPSAPLTGMNFPEQATMSSYSDAGTSYSWDLPSITTETGFIDPRLDALAATDSTDASSEYSYGSGLHQPSPAPGTSAMWSRTSYETGPSMTSTPAQSSMGQSSLPPNWTGDDLMRLLSIESPELSPLNQRAGTSWYSTSLPLDQPMSRTDSVLGFEATTSIPSNNLWEDSTPTLENPLGLPGTFVDEMGQPQAAPNWDGHLENMKKYLNPLVHNSAMSNGFVPPSYAGVMIAIGLAASQDFAVTQRAQTLFEESVEALDSVAVPQDKLFRLTHMQLVWLAETFLQFRAESPTTCFTPKFLRLCHALANDPDRLPNIDLASYAYNYVNKYPTSLEDAWRYWIYREGKRRLFLRCYFWDIQTHLIFGRERVMTDDTDFALPHSAALWNATSAEDWYAVLQQEAPTFSQQPRKLSDLRGPKGQNWDSKDYAIITAISLWNVSHAEQPLPQPPSTFTMTFTTFSYNVYHMVSHTPIADLLTIAGSRFGPEAAPQSTLAAEKIKQWRHTPDAQIAVRFARHVLYHAWTTSWLKPNDTMHKAHVVSGPPGISGPLHEQWDLYLAVLVCWACSDELVTAMLSGLSSSQSQQTPHPIVKILNTTKPATVADNVIVDFIAGLDLSLATSVPVAEMPWLSMGIKAAAGWIRQRIQGTMGGLTKAACEVLRRIEEGP